MRTLLLFIFLTYISNAYSQTNIITNGGFEESEGCPTKPTEVPNTFDPLNIPHLNHWVLPERENPFCKIGSSDYLNTCGAQDCINTPHNGSGYAGLITTYLNNGYGEFITGELNTYILQGHTYYLEFYVSTQQNNNAIGNIDVMFTMQRPEFCSYTDFSNQNNQILKNPSLIPFSGQWIKMSYTFTSMGTYKWITFGGLRQAYESLQGNDNKYYCLDDLKLFDLGINCSPIRLIQNFNVEEANIEFNSSNILIAGENVNSQQPNGPVVIEPLSKIVYKANKSVTLKSGFTSEYGSKFVAKIAPCNSNCFSPNLSIPSLNYTCGFPINIGTNNQNLYTYSWNTVNQSDLNYLSSATISNPIFSPPKGLTGEITYNLNVTNDCNETKSYSTTILYFSEPFQNGNVAVSNHSVGQYLDQLSFDITHTNNIEQIKIEIINQQGHVTNQYILARGIDFTCCNFRWTLPLSDFQFSCDTYTVSVTGKPFCKTQWLTPTIFTWKPGNVPHIYNLPNVFSPPTPPNENLCLTVSGANHIFVNVFNRWGDKIYTSFVPVVGNTACIWNGTCNRPPCQGSYVSSGTYYIEISITNSCGSQINSNFYVSLFNSLLRSSEVLDQKVFKNDSIYNNESNKYEYVSSNKPIKNDNNQLSESKIVRKTVYDISGKLIIDLNYDIKLSSIENLASGLYIIKYLLSNGNTIINKEFIYDTVN